MTGGAPSSCPCRSVSPMGAVLLPIIVCTSSYRIMVRGGCGRLAGMRGGSVVGQTVQPVQAWKNVRFKLYD